MTPSRNASSTAGGDPPVPSYSYTHGLTGVNLPMDKLFTDILWLSMAALALLVFVTRLVQTFNNHLRHINAMGVDKQKYWQNDHGAWWPRIKRYLVTAPFWSKRHNREIQLSAAINFGTLPSRFHSIVLFLYVFSNIAYCAILDYNKPKMALVAEVRGRTGVLAVVNMLPLILLSTRNNPLIPILRVSFDTYNLLHRWIGRIVVLEALAHTLAWGANTVIMGGHGAITAKISASKFLMWGTVGTAAFTFLIVHSPSAIRHAFYETFLTMHVIAAAIAIIGVYMHLKVHQIPQLTVLKLVIAIWVLERSARVIWLLYRNVSRKGCTAVTVQALGEDACRVSFELARPWTNRPGSHAFVYLPTISGLQNHPFSIAWADDHSIYPVADEKLPTSTTDLLAQPTRTRTTVSMVVQKRTGFTARLHAKAVASPSSTIILPGAIEGPYGGHDSLKSYGTVVMFAGGIGITHHISHIRDLVAGFDSATVATRKITLIWTVRATEQLEWVRPWMDRILAMPQRRAVLKILLFVTRPRSARELISPSATVQMYPGRPIPQVVLDKEIAERVGAVAVTVCGPGSLADSVREAARRRMEVASVDFLEEAFTW
ncbi:MAG: hypothetical protein M1814_006469 [Vezdaea aestivalis]|nr:MAG: hypothetical protein M1814_006469 [Vezdaea aestivalis]